MNNNIEFKINTESKSYILATSEYMGSKDFKYMIRSELRGGVKVTLFLLGIPNPAAVYANGLNSSPDAIKKKLYLAVNESIAEYIGNNEWIEGGVYYGEYRIDGSFEITPDKPLWEDGEWGQKVDL